MARGTRALLCASGLPQAFWLYAAMSFCFFRNIQDGVGGKSPWRLRFAARRNQQHYAGLKAPFGSLVSYVPAPTTVSAREKGKFETTTVEGVILGYQMLPGGKWRQQYWVMPLAAFEDMPLNARATKLGNSVVKVPDTCEYPVKAESDRANFDYFGGDVQDHRRRQDVLMDQGPSPRRG